MAKVFFKKYESDLIILPFTRLQWLHITLKIKCKFQIMTYANSPTFPFTSPPNVCSVAFENCLTHCMNLGYHLSATMTFVYFLYTHSSHPVPPTWGEKAEKHSWRSQSRGTGSPKHWVRPDHRIHRIFLFPENSWPHYWKSIYSSFFYSPQHVWLSRKNYKACQKKKKKKNPHDF